MSGFARQLAEEEQGKASDPAVSAFVAASAGSGKTKLLTDRLLRLMLSGADPARIQCLTFTKAAAAEMAIRLHRVLGRWVTLDDAALDGELSRLGAASDAEARSKARALFAEVLDLPGGMRIGTIHAFCQSLLRRFPLEARLSPHFRLIEDRDAEEALRDAREHMLAGAASPAHRTALDDLAGLATLDGFGRLVAGLQADRAQLARALELPDLAAAQRRALGIVAADPSGVIAAAASWPEEAALVEAAKRVHREGSPKCAEKSGRLLEWLGLSAAERAENWSEWRCEFLTEEGKARAVGAFLNPKLAAQCPELAEIFAAEAERVRLVDDDRCAFRVAQASLALVTLAAPVLGAYEARKDDGGLLDYDDLIGRTSALLVDPGAAWVLYKLDGGLDHLLLDEVQDTSPAQWRIAHAMIGEFFAGEGAREANRTVFAVGDRKQSIYSFQGADADEFDRSRDLLAARVRDSGHPWRDVRLDVSFRSTAPVLTLVDRVFANGLAAAGVVAPGERLRHIADRAGQAGAVELWPLAPRLAPPPSEPWSIPPDYLELPSAPQLLADRLADWLREQTSGAVMLASKDRPLAPGDVLVLVRRRNAFARALVRALKARGVPVAGLDRLVLTEQPAVQDLLALCDTLLLPEDDLSLACVLTSPLGGLTDDDLMALAVGRDGALWDALRRRAGENPRWQSAWDFIARLLPRVDYTTPHTLLSEALGPLGGRARLYARLGPEAAEPVDELLSAALAYTRTHPPALQGFVQWLRQSGAEVKREAEAAGGAVRIMTVHGAKGLQAPLVILPDTTALPPDDGPLLWETDPMTGVDVPLWAPRKEVACAATHRVREHVRARRMEEHNRLLYVALTRAEDRLVVCGWEPSKPARDDCWYALVRGGFDGLGAEEVPFGEWGTALRLESPQRDAPERAAAVETGPAAPLPAWAGASPDWRPAPPPPEPARPEPLAPSRPEGAGLGPVPHAVSPLTGMAGEKRFQRGKLIHALLQHLPSLPAADRPAAARAWLDRPGQGLTREAVEAIAAETLAILAHPELAPLFGPGSRAEVPLTGVVAGSVVGGLVDRLAVLPDHVLVADFKTNRDPPRAAEATPVLYLRQMAAYRAVLRAVFPDRPVRCALIWTRAAQVTMLPDALLDPHAPGASPELAG
ncbi:MAG: double-strand break repair helicase AddA [Alphaproteobacteria bacterium]|nr:double-strand break repair helicase AddA [Alphaproteobacteria bacterium]